MISLNIVSLPKYLHEVKLSLSNQLIDLIAFNETRLDPTKTNDQIKIDGYDVIRKDRSRTGGGVCIYLRSTINYRDISDLVPLDLKAVDLEIIKPHSQLENLIKAVDDENKDLHILAYSWRSVKSYSCPANQKIKTIVRVVPIIPID